MTQVDPNSTNMVAAVSQKKPPTGMDPVTAIGIMMGQMAGDQPIGPQADLTPSWAQNSPTAETSQNLLTGLEQDSQQRAQADAAKAAAAQGGSGDTSVTFIPGKGQPGSPEGPGSVSWIKDLEAASGVPDTPSNEKLFAAWQHAEGGGDGKGGGLYNWLNTTEDMPGAGWFNTFGSNGQYHVKNYTSYAQGIQALAKVLTTQPKNATVLALLRQSADPTAIANAIGASGWGTNAAAIRGSL